jgi:hypothetical protein
VLTVNYYHNDRIHDSLVKDAPNGRSVEEKPTPKAMVISNARLGGLHHRYAGAKRLRTGAVRLSALVTLGAARRFMTETLKSVAHPYETDNLPTGCNGALFAP